MSVPDPVAFGTARGRWVLAAAVLGSGIAFLDGSVVNAALPAIARDFDAGVDALQWTLTAYLLTQGSLLVLGGSLGDLYGRRRVFVYGLIGFAIASLLCAISQSSTQLELAASPAGRGRCRPGSGQPRAAVSVVPRGGPGPRHRRVVRARRHRHRGRAVPRRLAHRLRFVAADLRHQPSARASSRSPSP